MSITLKDLFIEEDYQNKKYIKVSKSDEEGFTEEQLERIQYRMLESNSLERVMPITFEKFNNEITMLYGVEGKQKLSEEIRLKGLTMPQFYQLMINVLQALTDSGNNMLKEDNFIIDEDHIYLDNYYHKVNVIYLPLKDYGRENTLHEDIKKLLINIAADVKGINGSHFKIILNYIKNPGFSINGLKALLNDLLKKGYEHDGEEDGAEQDDKVQTQEKKIKKVRTVPSLSKKYRIYTYLIAVILVLLIITQIGFGNPTISGLSVILIMLVVAGTYVFMKKWRPGVEPVYIEKSVPVKQNRKSKVENVESAHEKEEKDEKFDAEVYMNSLENEEGTSVENAAEVAVDKSVADEVKDSDEFPVSDMESEYKVEDRTMLLNYDDDPQHKRNVKIERPKAKFKLTSEDIEPFEINKEPFSVGRTDNNNDYAVNVNSVSRKHLELSDLDDSLGVRDLGSKNGTFINGNKLVPQKVYELKLGETLKIGETSFKLEEA